MAFRFVVSFKMDETMGRPIAELSMDVLSSSADIEFAREESERIYLEWLRKLRRIKREIEKRKSARKPILARQVWEFGREMFNMVEAFESLDVEIDDLYGHLQRDLAVSKTFLKRAATFARYLPTKEYIPRGKKWVECSYSPKNAALRMLSDERNQ